MNLAERQNRLGTETAFETLAKAKELERQGKHIVHLEIGEPDFDSPEHVINAAKKALDDGFTHYGPSAGQPELREAIAVHQGEFNGYSISPERVIVTPGGKPVMFFSILALVQEGDEVIYPNPGFPIYESMINYSGAKPVPMKLEESKDFISGWLKDESVSGRPSAPFVLSDGSMLLSDDKANVIYRITYET